MLVRTRCKYDERTFNNTVLRICQNFFITPFVIEFRYGVSTETVFRLESEEEHKGLIEFNSDSGYGKHIDKVQMKQTPNERSLTDNTILIF